MTKSDKLLAQRLYLMLGALFIASLVVSNLIFKKFFYWYPVDIAIFGSKLFELSAAILPYCITFLITDLISEIYGKKRANDVVIAGIFASLLALNIIYVANALPATEWSPVDNTSFSIVFSSTAMAVISTMVAYLFAQFIDIQVYDFLKRTTKGKHLWLRNNFSTWASQFTDTFIVLILLCIFGEVNWDKFYGLLITGVLFKFIAALLDTPLLYLFVYLFKKRFKLKQNQELKLI